jgi:hypothetical protein
LDLTKIENKCCYITKLMVSALKVRANYVATTTFNWSNSIFLSALESLRYGLLIVRWSPKGKTILFPSPLRLMFLWVIFFLTLWI